MDSRRIDGEMINAESGQIGLAFHQKLKAVVNRRQTQGENFKIFHADDPQFHKVKFQMIFHADDPQNEGIMIGDV